MHEIIELEKRWYRYKLKKFLNKAMIFLSVALAIFLIYYFVFNKNANDEDSVKSYIVNMFNFSKSTMKEKKEVEEVVIQKSEESNKSIEIAQTTPHTDVALMPIIPVIDMAKEERIKQTRKPRVKRTKPAVRKHHPKLVKAKPNSSLTAKELSTISKVKPVTQATKVEPHVTKKINFQTTTINYIETMKKKFIKSKNPRDAILISKALYKKRNYAKAEAWALTANKLSKNLEESWLLFAKSKAKQGKKQEAINILASYYQKSKSAKAKGLIEQIKRGNF